MSAGRTESASVTSTSSIVEGTSFSSSRFSLLDLFGRGTFLLMLIKQWTIEVSTTAVPEQYHYHYLLSSEDSLEDFRDDLAMRSGVDVEVIRGGTNCGANGPHLSHDLPSVEHDFIALSETDNVRGLALGFGLQRLHSACSWWSKKLHCRENWH